MQITDARFFYLCLRLSVYSGNGLPRAVQVYFISVSLYCVVITL